MKATWLSTYTLPLSLAAMLAMAPAVMAQPVEITMWDIPESDVYSDWWRAHVEEFNASHPDIKVTLEIFETEAYRPKIASALAAGTAPEIFYLPAGPQGFQAFRDGQAGSLEGILNADAFTETSMASCSVDGTLVCMPLYIAPNLIYYNKAQFETAGIDPATWADPTQPTWEEFIAASDALKAVNIVPIALGNGDSWPGTMYMWAFQNRFGGIDELDAAVTGKDGATFSASPGFVRAAESVAELGASPYLPLGYNGITGGQKYTLFTAGNAAMIFQGPWLLGRIATDAPADFQYGVFEFPSFADGDADSQKDVIGGFDALFVSPDTEKSEAVATFLNSFADPEVALDFMVETQNISVVKSALETGPGPGILADIAQITASAPHITPWWDNYMPTAIADESTRAIQGLFDGSIAPADYLAGMDKSAGR